MVDIRGYHRGGSSGLGCLFVSGCLIAATCTGASSETRSPGQRESSYFPARKISVSGIAAGDARKARAAGLAGATARPSGYSNPAG